MALLGKEGNGFELARELESHGLWRRWLGEGLYSQFIHSLSSPSAWDSFMSSDDSKSRVQIQLQLRVRAVLFDKAALSPFPRKPHSHSVPSPVSSPPIVSKLNPNYLQLHGDDLYFTLEDVPQQREGPAFDSALSEVQSRANFGSRYSESEVDSVSQRFKREDFAENWYNQFIEKYKSSKPYVLSSFNRDSEKRTPSAMANYLRHREKHKRRRIAFKEDSSTGSDCSAADNSFNNHLSCGVEGDSSDDDSFRPETMFVMNCVPDRAIPPISAVDQKPKVEFFGVLDKLPQMATKNSIMIERLGISMDQGPGKTRSRVGSEGRKWLTQEQAVVLSKKAIGQTLIVLGFEGSSEVPVNILSQFLGCHISKLGNMLRVLADSYRKKYSAIELLRMFLRVVGQSNIGMLAEYIKDGKSSAQQVSRSMHSIQAQMQLTHQNPLQLPQQIHRQMLPQMQQMIHPQQFTQQQQQQWARMRRAQAQGPTQAQVQAQGQAQAQALAQAHAHAQAQAQVLAQANSPQPTMSMDKDNRPMVEVKIENTDIPTDSNNAFNAMNNRQTQFHLRQQQIAAIQRLAQTSGQYRQQLNPLQIAQMQQSTQNAGGSRAPPVKVEGFQELMGGDSSLKHDSSVNKLTSPSK